MYNDWLSIIDESVKANVHLIKKVQWVHIFDMQTIMCIIQ